MPFSNARGTGALPDREQFIETQAAFQFGRCEAESGLDLKDVAIRAASTRPSLALHNIEDGSFIPPERGAGVVRNGHEWTVDFGGAPAPLPKLKAGRKANVLSDIYELGLRAPAILDMNDAAGSPNAFPAFQYNRLSGAPNCILWPLQRVHAIGSKEFVSLPDPAEPTLGQKQPRVFWRGSLRGFSSLGRKPRNITGLVKSHVKGRLKRDDLLRHLQTVSRYLFVSRYFANKDFDIGFSAQPDKMYMGRVPEINRFERGHVSPAGQLACKYLVSIGGTDVASSFGWQLSTNSVILRETYPWEVFFDCHFRPWEHYVPIQPDFADVLEKIDWCENHLAECQQMVTLRHRMIPLLLDKAARREALRRVVARYNDFCSARDYLPRAAVN